MSKAGVARSSAIDIAHEEWEMGIKDPSSKYFVDREGGLYKAQQVDGKWEAGEYIEDEHEMYTYSRILDYIQDGLQWTWIEKYRNRSFQWCGAFCSFLFRDSVRDELRHKRFSSTYRLHQWAKEDPSLVVDLDDIQPGDIVIVGKSLKNGGKSYGDHITLAIDVDSSGVHTIEGNAFGEHFSGKRCEGVIKEYRPFKGKGDKYKVKFAYRIQDHHIKDEYLTDAFAIPPSCAVEEDLND